MSELRKQRVKAFFFKRKKIKLKYGYTELLGKNIKEVEILLYNQALSNIKLIPIKDIYVGSPYQVGQIDKLIIAGNSYFNAGDQIPYDSEVIVTYHVKREITIPFNAKDLRKVNYVIAENKLRELGFTEINERPIQDLVTGWVKKDGAIEKVTIDNVHTFSKNSVFCYDAKIVIEYHTFKNK